jgi:hypothetical protein
MVSGAQISGFYASDIELRRNCAYVAAENEGIKMDSLGKPVEWFVRNVQVEGDLARERGDPR